LDPQNRTLMNAAGFQNCEQWRRWASKRPIAPPPPPFAPLGFRT
jgi:hypothetical protein